MTELVLLVKLVAIEIKIILNICQHDITHMHNKILNLQGLDVIILEKKSFRQCNAP